jgi:hypothetical protein
MHRGNHLFLIKFWLEKAYSTSPTYALGLELLTHFLRGECYLCATQVAILAREENSSFLRILPIWFSTARLEIESS